MRATVVDVGDSMSGACGVQGSMKSDVSADPVSRWAPTLERELVRGPGFELGVSVMRMCAPNIDLSSAIADGECAAWAGATACAGTAEG